jgi:hypothetical protein
VILVLQAHKEHLEQLRILVQQELREKQVIQAHREYLEQLRIQVLREFRV